VHLLVKRILMSCLIYWCYWKTKIWFTDKLQTN